MNWMRLLGLIVVCGGLFVLAGCQTVFYGSATVEDGAQGCEAKCADEGLELAGMVMLGEYTDGCICAVPGHEQQALDAAGTTTGAAIGVIEQMDRRQQHARPH